jgi:hypothetical protein
MELNTLNLSQKQMCEKLELKFHGIVVAPL